MRPDLVTLLLRLEELLQHLERIGAVAAASNAEASSPQLGILLWKTRNAVRIILLVRHTYKTYMFTGSQGQWLLVLGPVSVSVVGKLVKPMRPLCLPEDRVQVACSYADQIEHGVVSSKQKAAPQQIASGF